MTPLVGRSSNNVRRLSGRSGSGIRMPEDIHTAAGRSFATPSPEMVQNRTMENIVTSEAERSRPKIIASIHAKKCVNDAGPRRPKNKKAIVSSGAARSSVGADNIASARQYQDQ